MHEVRGKSLLLVGLLGIWRTTPEWVGDIARSVLVLSATINIWGGAQRWFLKRICDVEEWCLKIGFNKVKITQVKCLHAKNLGDRNVYNDESDWQLLQQEWFEGIGTVVCVACRRSDLESDRLSTRRNKTQLPWFCNGDDYHCSSFSFVWKNSFFYTCFCIECHCFSCNNLLKLMLRRCIWIILGVEMCAFSASFVKECTDVSYVAEGVELTAHQKGKCCCRENKGSRIEISSWANLSMTKITIETQSCT